MENTIQNLLRTLRIPGNAVWVNQHPICWKCFSTAPAWGAYRSNIDGSDADGSDVIGSYGNGKGPWSWWLGISP